MADVFETFEEPALDWDAHGETISAFPYVGWPVKDSVTNEVEVELVKKLVQNWKEVDHQDMLRQLSETQNSLAAVEEEFIVREQNVLNLLEVHDKFANGAESIIIQEAKQNPEFRERMIHEGHRLDPHDQLSQNKWRHILAEIEANELKPKESTIAKKLWRWIKSIYRSCLRTFVRGAWRRDQARKFLLRMLTTKRFRADQGVGLALNELSALIKEGGDLKDDWSRLIISVYRDDKLTEDQRKLVAELAHQAEQRPIVSNIGIDLFLQDHKKLLERVILNLDFSSEKRVELARLESASSESKPLDHPSRFQLNSLELDKFLFEWWGVQLKKTSWILQKIRRELELTEQETKFLSQIQKSGHHRALKPVDVLQSKQLENSLDIVIFDEQLLYQQKAELYLLDKKEKAEKAEAEKTEMLLRAIEGRHEMLLQAIDGHDETPQSIASDDHSIKNVIIEFARLVDKHTGDGAVMVIDKPEVRRRFDWETMEGLKGMSTLGTDASSKARNRIKMKLFQTQLALTTSEKKVMDCASEKALARVKLMAPKALAFEMIKLCSRNPIFPTDEEALLLLDGLLMGSPPTPLQTLSIYSLAKDYTEKLIDRMTGPELALLWFSDSDPSSPLSSRLRRSCFDLDEMYTIAKASDTLQSVSEAEWLRMVFDNAEKLSMNLSSDMLQLKESLETHTRVPFSHLSLVRKFTKALNEPRDLNVSYEGLDPHTSQMRVIQIIGSLNPSPNAFQDSLVVSQLSDSEYTTILKVYQEFVMDSSLRVEEAYQTLASLMKQAKARLQIAKDPYQIELNKQKLKHKIEHELEEKKLEASAYTQRLGASLAWLQKMLAKEIGSMGIWAHDPSQPGQWLSQYGFIRMEGGSQSMIPGI